MATKQHKLLAGVNELHVPFITNAGDPSGTVTAAQEHFVYDTTNEILYRNTDGGTTYELFSYRSAVVAGTIEASKVPVLDASKKVNEWLVDSITLDGGDIKSWEAVNDGSPEVRVGSADAEEYHIQAVYDTGAQTLDYVLFQTDVASVTANKGLYRFNVDGTAILDIDDGGIDLAAAKALSIAGTDVLTATVLGSGVVTSSLTALGTIATGVWQGTAVGVAYGGTGATTLTDGGILLGSGVGAVTITARPTTAQLLIGQAAGDPTVAVLSGDVTMAATGAVTIATAAVTYAKMQDVSATDKVLGRATAGAGDVEEIAMTAAGRALMDDADAAAQRTTLGLGTADTPQFARLGLGEAAAEAVILTLTHGTAASGVPTLETKKGNAGHAFRAVGESAGVEDIAIIRNTSSTWGAADKSLLQLQAQQAGGTDWNFIQANNDPDASGDFDNLVFEVDGLGNLFATQLTTGAPSGGTAGTWKLGVTAVVTPTSPNRTIEVDIGGTIYYIHAKTTNN